MISQILIETRSPATNASPASDLAAALVANASPASDPSMSRVPARSIPVSAIRFPQSRKNFFLLNFYFLLSPVLFVTDLFHPLNHLTV